MAHGSREKIGAADERGDERRRRAIVDVLRAAGLRHAALGHDHDVIRNLHRFFLIVRDQNGRHVPLVVKAPQPRAQLDAHLRVERAERLVEQQDLRLDGERTRKGDALALTSRKLRSG